MDWLIGKVIEFSIRRRALVLLLVAALSLWGLWAVFQTPVDAIPDLSENQVIVWADWPGRSPKEIEDQVTYPLSVNLQGLSGVKSIRATSEFGFSMINIIFDEDVDFYFARQRVLERLSIAGGFLPGGVVPYLAPDATALGQIFWYTVEGEGKSLDELRAVQDWYVRYQLNSVEGVAQVSSVGGFVREYQIDVDPDKLRAYDVSLGQVFRAVQMSNSSVGGKVIHEEGAEYLVRGYGWIQTEDDIRDVVVVERSGVPVTVDRLATVQLGPGFRRSVLEKGGREAVGGVVMMRFGENPLEVTRRVQRKIEELQPGLPRGVRIVPFYDRTGLIEASIGTLTRTLIEEILIATAVVFLVLWHVRSALAICITLPLAVLVSFLFMYYLGVPSNIMSLSGIAISIGVLVDAGIVMTENAYNRLHEHFGSNRVSGDTRPIVLEACRTVGGPLFFSILIMVISFLPIFVLGGIEGRMFNPLAYTKTFALAGVALLAITLVPAILPTLLRGRLRSQEEVWVVRSFVNIYRPMLEFFLKHPSVIVAITGIVLVAGLKVFPPKVPWIFFVLGVPVIVALSAGFLLRRPATLALTGGVVLTAALAGWVFFKRPGEEFMPPLDELSLMDMPVTTPNVNITQVGDDLKERDNVLQEFPEVHQVVGKAGRAETPTDPAPIDMVETVITFRPHAWWPRRKIQYEDARRESDGVARALVAKGILSGLAEDDMADFANSATMTALGRFDASMRSFAKRRFLEFVPEVGRDLLRLLRDEVLELLDEKGLVEGEDSPEAWAAFEERHVERYAAAFAEWILVEDVGSAAREVADHLVAQGVVRPAADLLAPAPDPVGVFLERVQSAFGMEPPKLLERLRRTLVARLDELMRARVKDLDWEIADRAPGACVWFAIEGAIEQARLTKHLGREPAVSELQALRVEREGAFGESIFLWKKTKTEIRDEMDSELRIPGWGNIWTQPIINRVDMLSTGVRTMIGVKIFGQGGSLEEGLGTMQEISGEIAEVLKKVPGAVDVVPDQIVGENYLEIRIDRKQAARYGVAIEDIQDVIEVALGGKEITLTVEGRERFPVRVRYPRDRRVDEELVKGILVAAMASEDEMTPGEEGMTGPGERSMVMSMGMAASSLRRSSQRRLRQVPLSLVAKVRVVPGPSMIKSENGLLRSYVQLNVRNRDIVGFVEEAKRAVESKVELPPGYYIQWSGQFEHQERAQRTLTIVFPLVLFLVFIILYLTYGDLPDTLMMFLAVPGAIAGGALFQYLWGYKFSVAVWVGYIACFGLATETGIVMLVYLRESIAKRGGMEAIRSEEEIREAVMEGAVHRLRPKLLTEGTTILALIPMLWATGVGAEFMRPMAAPILGGILVADEVIDIFIPVLFYHERCRRLRKWQAKEARASAVGAVP